MGFNSLGNILGNRHTQSPLIKGVTAAMVMEEANKQLAIIFGAGIAEYASAAYLRHTTLCIACLSTTAAQEIRLHEAEFIAAINQKMTGIKITKIRYLS